MAIRPEYRLYLQHFGRTRAVEDLFRDPSASGPVALRHDVDHSLDLALEMAWLEAEQGCRATYFVLPDQPYAREDRFLEKCLQIQALGHEVGLHNNVLTRWISDGREPREELDEELRRLRAAGLRIAGTSTHGDRLCYVHRYLNSWCFRESRPGAGGGARPLNAEGQPATKPADAILPPASGFLEVGGRRLDLWTLTMAGFGLDYEAHRVSADRYFTDSGGTWTRSPDPLKEDLSAGRIQVLMHPDWWAEAKRFFFFLSTARSGSKWLLNLLGKATACVARHEFSLNHRFDGTALSPEKNTGSGFEKLRRDPGRARSLLEEVRAWTDTFPNDYVEANVYLGHFIGELREVFPEATIVHLHRDGRDVVRSLLNRSWYDTPEDDRHPSFDVAGWEGLSSLEKACWYWRLTNEAIAQVADHRVALETLTADIASVAWLLSAIGLRLSLPELARREHPLIVNAGHRHDVPPFGSWLPEDRAVFERVSGPVQALLGYASERPETPWSAPAGGPAASAAATLPRAVRWEAAPVLEGDFTSAGAGEIPLTASGCAIERTAQGVSILVAKKRPSHAHVVYGGTKWGQADPDALFLPRPGAYYRLEVDLKLSEGLGAALHALVYDDAGRLQRARHFRPVRAGMESVSIAFRPLQDTAGFTFGLYFGKNHGGGECLLRAFRVLEVRALG